MWVWKKYNSTNNIFLKNKSLNKERKSITYYNDYINKNIFTQLNSLENKINVEKELKFGKLRPKELISEALKVGEKINSKEFIENKNKTNKIDIIYDTKIMARTLYIDHIFEKSKHKINEEFKDILKSCNKMAKIRLEKNLEEIKNIKNANENLQETNKLLEYKVSDINNDVKEINQKLIEKNKEINKLQIKLDSFGNMIPFFEELINQFPNEQPNTLINNYYENKKKSLEQLDILNSLDRRFYQLNKERDVELSKENIEKEKIEKKIEKEKKTFEDKMKSLEDEIKIYQKEYDTIKENNEKKLIFNRMLFNLYKNIKRHIPKQKYNEFIKKIGFNPIKNEKIFDCSIFNNIHYIKLVQECIANKASDCYDGKILRITIVFANYLARKYLTHNNKSYRYDPLLSFRDIKTLIDNKKFENYRLRVLIQNLKKKQTDLKMKRRELENIFKKAKKKYDELFSRLELAKNIQLASFKSKYNDNFKTLDITNQVNDIKSERNKKRTKSAFIKALKIEDNNKGNIYKTIENKNKNNKIFLTTIDKTFKKPQSKKNLKFNLSDKKVLIKKLENNKTKLKFLNDKTKNNELKELTKKFKDLQISKNRDKLYKKNGINSSENIFINIRELMKELLQQENKELFKDNNLYKNKKLKKDKLTIETHTHSHIPLLDRKLKNMEKEKRNKTEVDKRPFSCKMTDDINYKNISNNVMNNIDKLINNMKELQLKDLIRDKYVIKNFSDNKINTNDEKDKNKIIKNKGNNEKIKEEKKIRNNIGNNTSIKSEESFSDELSDVEINSDSF